MLANQFTTTQPVVNIGEREQYRQLDESSTTSSCSATSPWSSTSAAAVLTSVSSYTDRDILVTRDATQLTGSVTYYNLGGDGDRHPPQLATARLHAGRGLHAGIAAQLRQRRRLPVGGRRLLQRHGPPLRPDACRRRATTTSDRSRSAACPNCAAPDLGAPVATCRSTRTSRTRSSRSRFFAEGQFPASARGRTSRSAAATTISRKTAC